MTKEEREVFTERLSKIVDLIDRNGNTYIFRVVSKFFDGNDYVDIPNKLLKEKLVLAHMEPNLLYLVVDYEDGWGGKHYKSIRYVFSNNSYSANSNTLKTDSYEDTCCIVSDLYKHFD